MFFDDASINTMKQDARHGRSCRSPTSSGPRRGAQPTSATDPWDYIYEPDAKELLDGRAARATSRRSIYQMVNENMASEQIGAHGRDEGRLGQRR